MVVKPGFWKLGIERSKEINTSKREELNLLLIRQSYLTRKVKLGEIWKLGELKTVHKLIDQWYRLESEKIQTQSRANEYQEAEVTRIYHHEIHKRKISKGSILKLETEDGTIEGHSSCSRYLEKSVEDLLLHPVYLDPVAQQALLSEVVPVFTESDNEMMITPPTSKEVWNTVAQSNLKAAPGTDGIPSMLYKECWDSLGTPLTEVMCAIHEGEELGASMRTSLMVFGNKPKKAGSLLPKDKRRISLLNSDFKVASGLEASRFKKTITRTLSPNQLVAGEDRRIHHGIAKARNAIYSAGREVKKGCGILDTDYMSAFDLLVLDWVFLVLAKKGLCKEAIDRIKNLYKNNISVVVVNNIQGKAVLNIRLSLRQGDVPSMHFFAYAIDPLLILLDRILEGILIHSSPTFGPLMECGTPPTPVEERYKVVGYADDAKPAITSMKEFITVDKSCALFEAASGCRLHRDPASQKCKFLPLGKWKKSLKQEDIPCDYMTLSDHLEMVGCELRSTWTQSRKANGDILQKRVENTIKPWKAGKFMDISQRGFSINSYCISKVMFRCHTVDLRVGDISKITSSIKSFLYQDQFEKPEEIVMYRPTSYGGLGVMNVKYRALAALIKTFLEQAGHPQFLRSQYHTDLFRYHVSNDYEGPVPVQPPYYSLDFFSTIKSVWQEGRLNVFKMTLKEWYSILLDKNVTMVEGEEFLPSRAEIASIETDWEITWRRVRTQGLGSQLTSFLWRLCHRLLPTQQRLSHLTPSNVTSFCKSCIGKNREEIGSLKHELIECPENDSTGSDLVSILRIYSPGLTADQVLRLEFGEIGENQELPIIFFTASTLFEIWTMRAKGAKIRRHLVRANLEARIAILRTTRHTAATTILQKMLNNLPL